MVILLAIPLGILCLIIGWVCFRGEHTKQAVFFSILGASALAFAALMSLATHLLVKQIGSIS